MKPALILLLAALALPVQAQVVTPAPKPTIIMIMSEELPFTLGRVDDITLAGLLVGRVTPGIKRVNISIDGKLTGTGFAVVAVRPDGYWSWPVDHSLLDSQLRSVRVWVPAATAGGPTQYLDNASALTPFKFALRVATFSK